MTPRFLVTHERLDLAQLTATVEGDAGVTGEYGAIVTFVGLVRAHNQGRRVLWLDYEAFEVMAERTFERIAAEAALRWPATGLGVHHRTGRLEIGEASVAIAAASAHRADAYGACRYAIERVKQIAPIWKREFYEGGDCWIEGALADPDDDHARQEAMRHACP